MKCVYIYVRMENQIEAEGFTNRVHNRIAASMQIVCKTLTFRMEFQIEMIKFITFRNHPMCTIIVWSARVVVVKEFAWSQFSVCRQFCPSWPMFVDFFKHWVWWEQKLTVKSCLRRVMKVKHCWEICVVRFICARNIFVNKWMKKKLKTKFKKEFMPIKV